jgi:hypothetical protein
MIEAETGRVAFELKSGAIDPANSQSNFQASLRSENGSSGWLPWRGPNRRRWEEWQRDVTRITSIRIKMVPPNPRYRGKDVEDLIEGAKLSAATLAVQGDDIQISESELLEESIEHFQAGYGTLSATAVVGTDDRKVVWRSEDEGKWRGRAPSAIRRPTKCLLPS